MFDDATPIFRQIAERIKADVVTGVLAPDSQVMSTNQYAAFYGINPATAARAFSDLVDEGVLYKRRGIGMFVAPGAREKLVAERRERYFTDVLGPAIEEARSIGIPMRDIIAYIPARSDEEEK